MGHPIIDSFYIDDDSVPHRVSGLRYSEDGESVSTFCDREFDIDSEDDLFHIPINLLRNDEVCIECERSHSYIQHDRFSFMEEQEGGDYKFFIKASLRVGENKGFIISETVEADSVEEAKNQIEEEYEKAEVYKYKYVVKSSSYTEFEVLEDNTVEY